MAWAARTGEGQRMASFRWAALNCEGPGAEPAGNERMALMTVSWEIFGGGGGGS